MRHVSRRSAPISPAGLTLVEVLMSMLVAGIGVLSVIVLLPLSFVRAIQATNLTNGTILRFNAESLSDITPSLLLRWQPGQAYSNTTPNASSVAGGLPGDIVLVPSIPTFGFRCTVTGTSGLTIPNPFNTGIPTIDGGVTWTPFPNPPTAFVIDPLGWNSFGSPLQTNFGNNGASPPAVDPLGIPRFNGQLTSTGLAALMARLPDSWVEQGRGAVTAFTTNTATISGPDLSAVGFTTPAAPGASIPVMSRVVLLDPVGKSSETRIITGVNAATGVVTWGGGTADPLAAGFAPTLARVETQDTRYTWMLTVHPNAPAATGGPSWNVTATIFFNRPLVSSDEQVYPATGADGAQSPFTVTYPAGAKPQFVKKGGFVFDCYFGRWYRIVNVVNDPTAANTLDVYVDQARPQTDILTNLNFGVVFMRGVVDQFPLVLK
jgi:hypothetical protein